jgi:hypothetical protein
MGPKKLRIFFIVATLTISVVTGCSAIETVHQPKVLFAAIHSAAIDQDLLAQDELIYRRNFRSIKIHQAKNLLDFYGLFQGNSYDIVHLLVPIQSDGTVDGRPATEILTTLAAKNVKLVILGIPDSSQTLHANRFGQAKINFIITKDRKGLAFYYFFKDLFGSMAKGKSFLNAWVSLSSSSQNSSLVIKDQPNLLAVPKRGDFKLRF